MRDQSSAGSVEFSRPFRVKEVLEKPRDLDWCHPRERQGWNLVAGEKTDSVCFLFCTGVPTNNIAQEKQLIGVVWNRRVAVKVAVQQCQKFPSLYIVTGFLLDFSDNSRAGGISNVCPSSRQCPAAIFLFPDQKQTSVAEDSGSHIDLGCCVSNICAEKFDKEIRTALP